MKQWIEKASHLTESLPYIRRFSGKIFVVKCGGAAMTDAASIKAIMQDIALLHFCGIRPVIVHGGGPEISAMCQSLQIPVQFVDGQRVTDEATLEVVQMVLLGKTNRSIVSALNQIGVKAVGVSGQDASFIRVKPYGDLGYVGEITELDSAFIFKLLAENYLPVISPIGSDHQGQHYNINADSAAGVIATALSAEKLIFLSDVDGIYADVNDPASRISAIKADNIKDYMQVGSISGGMVPKLKACLQAIEEGVPSAHILDGKIPHSLLLEIFTDEGVGTVITAL